jgi:hypothetical protein
MGKSKRKRNVVPFESRPGMDAPKGTQIAAEEAIDKLFKVASLHVTQWLLAQPKMPTEDVIMQQVDAALDQIFGANEHEGVESPFGQLLISAVRKGQRDFLAEQAKLNIALVQEAPIKGALSNAITQMNLRRAKPVA